MNKVLRITLNTLIIRLRTMGVLVSPAQRMTALNMLVPRVKGMAQAMIRKYREASPGRRARRPTGRAAGRRGRIPPPP